VYPTAEVMMEALRRLEIALRGLDARLLLTIHDEVLLDVRADPCLVRATAKILIDEMTAAFLHIFVMPQRRSTSKISTPRARYLAR
jgi:DNA polymerase I-like protein with 3'-5' exonuclease and polymerase domains